MGSLRSAERKEFMSRFGDRCRAARGKKSIVEAAAAMGVHRNTISNFETGLSLPDAYDLERLAKLYGTTSGALLGEEAHATAGSIAKSTEAIEVDEFVYVPLFDIKVSAGNGHTMFSDVETVLEMRPFPQGYIRRDLGIWHNEIALVTVVGSSMEPELHSRDVALLDRRDREVNSEGTHAIRLDSALLIKKLQRLPNRRLRVISANSAYDPFEIQGTEDKDRDFEVLGRVRGGVVIFH
ncbi:MAG TPA: LexA family transcriptional regulator [Burkholderiales bacterium]|nr:LexA family transcriptional regulator [Burkholderiales bacterium]